MELGGAQRADAGAAIDVDALRHRPQDLLVPDGRRRLEIAVDDADDRRAGERSLIEFALLDRRAPFERRIGGPEGRRQRWAGEDDGVHRHWSAARRTRGPGV